MIDRPDISLSVVSHGQGDLIRNLLNDLRSWRGATFELIVTLNIPEDTAFLDPFKDLPLTILVNPLPKGFGGNHNAAFRRSRGRYFAIVNPDIRATGLDLSSLLQNLQNSPSVGACAPRILSPEGAIEDSARRFPTLLNLAERVVLRRRVTPYDLAGRGTVYVDWVAGMFVVFSRPAFEAVSGFDENYFMYMEDADICRRLRRKGFSVLVDASTSVVHDARRASHRNLCHLRWHARSAVRFLTGV